MLGVEGKGVPTSPRDLVAKGCGKFAVVDEAHFVANGTYCDCVTGHS